MKFYLFNIIYIGKMYAITSKERLQQYAKYKFGSYREMEMRCGLVNGAIGTATELSMKNLIKVLEVCPELNPDWLILGVGTMERGKPVEKPAGIKLRQDGIEIVTAPPVAPVNEPTQPYKSKREIDEMVTIPSSILDALRQQLENKDAQIATLLQVINSKK
mgnify:CR=1 FL=1